MAFRFRKSVKLAPGIKLNVGKTGVGISAGAKGARVGLNSRGQVTTSVSIPGTGLSWRNTGGHRKKGNASSGKAKPSSYPVRRGVARILFGFLNIIVGIIAFGPDNMAPMLIEIIIGVLALVWGMIAFEKSGEEYAEIQIDENAPLLDQAVSLVLSEQDTSVIFMQQSLGIGFSEASALIDQMEELGVVGPYQGTRSRSILITREDWERKKTLL